MKRILFLGYLVFLSFSVLSQNLVINGSFENTSSCPETVDQFELLHNVINIAGTPDLYSCNSDNVGIPQNCTGYQEPADGDNYVGLVLIDESRSYQEYIALELSETLDVSKTYKVSLKVNVAESSIGFTRLLGVNLSSQPTASKYMKSDYLTYEFYKDKTGWEEIVFCYTPNESGEKYLIIGYQSEAGAGHVISTDHITSECNPGQFYYYYFDDFKVEEIIPTTVSEFSITDITKCKYSRDRTFLVNDSIANNELVRWSGSLYDPVTSKTGEDTVLIEINGDRAPLICATSVPSCVTDCISLEIEPNPFKTSRLDSSVCAGDTLVFTIDSMYEGYNYTWSNEFLVTDLSLKTAKLFSPDTYWFNLYLRGSNESNGCLDSVSIVTRTQEKVKVGLIDSVSLCSTENITLDANIDNSSFHYFSSWYTAAGDIKGAYTDTITLSPIESGYIYFRVSLEWGEDACITYDSTYITVKETILPVLKDTTITLGTCENLELDLPYIPSVEYLWNNLENATQSQPNSLIVDVKYPDTYIGKMKDEFGCEAKQVFNILIKPLVDLEDGYSVCKNDTFEVGQNIRGVNNVVYDWQPSRYLISKYGARAKFVASHWGKELTLFVTDTINNCTTNDQMIMSVDPFHESPLVNAGEDITICKGEVTSIGQPIVGYGFSWWGDEDILDSTKSEITISPDVSTTYFVKQTNSYGCSKIDSVNVFVLLDEQDVEVKYCNGEDNEIRIGSRSLPGVDYTWLNGGLKTSILLVKPDKDTVFTRVSILENCSYTTEYSISVVDTNLSVGFPQDTFFCGPQNIRFLMDPKYNYEWYSNKEGVISIKDTLDRFFTEKDTLYLTVKYPNCSVSESIIIDQGAQPIYSYPTSVVIGPDGTYLRELGNKEPLDNEVVSWSPGDYVDYTWLDYTDIRFTRDSNGDLFKEIDYTVEIENIESGCLFRDTINVVLLPLGKLEASPDTMCAGVPDSVTVSYYEYRNLAEIILDDEPKRINSFVENSLSIKSDQSPIEKDFFHIYFDITHHDLRDLTAKLISPSGEEFILFDNILVKGNGGLKIYLDETSVKTISDIEEGDDFVRVQPSRSFELLEGSVLDENWKLLLLDSKHDQQGYLNYVSLSKRYLVSNKYLDIDGHGSKKLPSTYSYTIQNDTTIVYPGYRDYDVLNIYTYPIVKPEFNLENSQLVSVNDIKLAWYYQGVLVDSSVVSIPFKGSGDYHAINTIGKCSFSSDTLYIVIAGDESNRDDEFDIYPTVTRNHVKMSSSNRILEIMVLNEKGQVLKKDRFDSYNIDYKLEGLLSGMYYLKIQTEEKETIAKVILLK